MNLLRSIYYLFGCLAFLTPLFAQASQVRVDSTGGLDMVLTDEAAAVTPFNLGNPAGLALLPAGAQLNEGLQWNSITSPSGYNLTTKGIFQNMGLGTPDIGGGNYNGLLVTDPNGWSFGLDAGFSDSSEDFTAANSTYDAPGGHESGQAAMQDGEWAFGTSFQFDQSSWSRTGSFPTSGDHSDGSIGVGALYSLPVSWFGDQGWVRLGGKLNADLLPYSMNDYFPQSVGKVTDNFSIKGLAFGPGIFLDFHGDLQGAVQFREYRSTGTMSRTSTYPSVPSIPEYKNQNTDQPSFSAIYKWKRTLRSGMDGKALTLNQGGSFGMDFVTINEFNPNGTTAYGFNQNDVFYRLGLGLERIKDFSLGAELVVNQGSLTNIPPSVFVAPNSTYSMFRMIFGGEKWTSDHFALRSGVSYLDTRNNSSIVNLDPGLYGVYPGQEIAGVLWTAGAGIEDKGVKIDGMFWFEEPSLTSTTPSQTIYTVVGAQCSLEMVL